MLDLAPRVDARPVSPAATSSVEVLELAEQFPARHTVTLDVSAVRDMTGLAEKIVAIHLDLDTGQLPHAFGGALALAWCTQRHAARTTSTSTCSSNRPLASEVLDALPSDVAFVDRDWAIVERDGQVRLFWDTTPVDLFLNTTHFHEQAATATRQEDFGDVRVPFLSCLDLAVFKAVLQPDPATGPTWRTWSRPEPSTSTTWSGSSLAYLGTDDERIACGLLSL